MCSERATVRVTAAHRETARVPVTDVTLSFPSPSYPSSEVCHLPQLVPALLEPLSSAMSCLLTCLSHQPPSERGWCNLPPHCPQPPAQGWRAVQLTVTDSWLLSPAEPRNWHPMTPRLPSMCPCSLLSSDRCVVTVPNLQICGASDLPCVTDVSRCPCLSCEHLCLRGLVRIRSMWLPQPTCDEHTGRALQCPDFP